MSRPEKYTTDAITAALEKTRGAIYLAADNLGCTAKTIFRRADRVQSVRDVIEKYSKRRVDIAEHALDRAVLNGEPWAIRLTLTATVEGQKRGYGKTMLEVTGKDGAPLIPVKYVEVVLPPEEPDEPDSGAPGG